MPIKVFLAHGALGPLDEMVMYSAPEVIVFLTLAFTWLRSRKLRREDEHPSSDGKPASAEPDEKP